MKIHRQLSSLPAFKNSIITIGSFDGVHAGHRKIFERMKHLARLQGLETIVVTFHPHPREIIYPRDKSLKLLNTLAEKAFLIETCGIDHLVIIPFTVEFAQLSPEEYVANFLVRYFNPKSIIIGYDHRFGLNRQGDIHHLKSYQTKFGFEVLEIERQEIAALAVSSSKTRSLIEEGKIAQANTLLTSPYPISGRVIKGQQLGKTLGFPTANLKVDSKKLLPPDGVYATLIEIEKTFYKGMLYIGKRPTLGLSETSIEVNIFDFDEVIYDEEIKLFLIDKIRNDTSFENLEALKKQLAKDKHFSLKALKDTALSLFSTTLVLPDTAIVILNYNGRHFLEKFLPGVIGHCPDFARVIIVDNASTDTSIAFMQEKYPSVECIELDKNYGFTGGYNKSLELISASYFILLNSDVEIKQDWVTPLIRLMESDKRIAACQPKILSQQNPTVFDYAGAAGGMMDFFDYPLCRGRVMYSIEPDTGQYNSSCEIFWATGAAMVIRAGLFQKFGGFQEEFFAHHEEIDLCWRLKNAGYKIIYAPESVVYHIGGGTLDYNSSRKTFLNFRNSFLSILKNERRSRLFWIFPLRLVLDGVAGFRFLLLGEFSNLKAIVRAHFDIYRTFGFWWRQRAKTKVIVRQNKIGTANMKGRIPQILLWHYFIKGKRFFSTITQK